MKPKTELDLHGVKHQDVEHTLENFFLWETKNQKQLIEVITGRSPQMQQIVTKWLDKYEFSYYIPAYNTGVVYVNS
jgi:DNA-nicking Smr family endonuclease